MRSLRLYVATLITATALLAGCRASAHQYVPLPDMSVELADKTKARVYVVRRAALFGARWNVDVYNGPTLIGNLAPGSYLCHERAPGSRVGRIVTDTGPLENDGVLERNIDANVKAGHVYYVAIDLDYRTRRANIELLEAEAGRELVAASSPAKVSLD